MGQDVIGKPIPVQGENPSAAAEAAGPMAASRIGRKSRTIADAFLFMEKILT